MKYFSKKLLTQTKKPFGGFLKRFFAKSYVKWGIVSIVMIFVLSTVFVNSVISAPRTFTVGTLFTVEEGSTLDQIAQSLKNAGYIRSPFVLKVIVKGLFNKDNHAVAGDYSFDQKLSTFQIARRILAGDFRLEPIRVTVPEGLNKYEMADLLSEYLPNFDKKKFVAVATEGYLFPDTYFFTPNTTPEKIVTIMRDNFNRRIAPHLEDIAKFGRPFDEVISMASIVETEARQYDTRQTISSILWKRFDEKMPLQVDVSFKYVNGKTTFGLTKDDLTIDSPYNSYKYIGLPPTPIANPGLDSILAAISPTKTDYYFFLSDQYGKMHYAETFDEHIANKRKYLP